MVLGLLSCKNIILKALLENSIYSVSGLRLSVEKIDAGLLRPYIKVEGLTLLNPPDFPDGIMFEIPLLYIEYDLAAALKKEVHIKDMDFHLKVLNVVRNKKGLVNLDSLNIVKLKKEDNAGEAGFPIRIDRLHLKGGSVVYADYRYDPPRITEFDIDIDEHYENVGDPYALGELIVSRSLYNTSISQLTGFDMGALKGGVRAVLVNGTDMVKDTTRTTLDAFGNVNKKAKDFVDSATGLFKDILKTDPDK